MVGPARRGRNSRTCSASASTLVLAPSATTSKRSPCRRTTSSALRPIERPYTVFVHVLDTRDEIQGQWDSEPLGGTYPTDVWPTGAVVRDAYAGRIADNIEDIDALRRLGVLDDPSKKDLIEKAVALLKSSLTDFEKRQILNFALPATCHGEGPASDLGRETKRPDKAGKPEKADKAEKPDKPDDVSNHGLLVVGHCFDPGAALSGRQADLGNFRAPATAQAQARTHRCGD